MNRRAFVQASAAAPALLGQARKRNLVFVLADDHRFDMLGCRGHPWLKTPHLDRLAQGEDSGSDGRAAGTALELRVRREGYVILS